MAPLQHSAALEIEGIKPNVMYERKAPTPGTIGNEQPGFTDIPINYLIHSADQA